MTNDFLTREMDRIKKEHQYWHQNLTLADTIAKQMKEIEQANSIHSQITNELVKFQLPKMAAAQHFQDMLSKNSLAFQSINQLYEVERTQHVLMRQAISPLDDIRNGLLADSPIQQLIKKFAETNSLQEYAKKLLTADEAALKILIQQADKNQHLLGAENISNSFQGPADIFGYINNAIPKEALGFTDSFREIQEQITKVAFPTIGWNSAITLANVLGQNGIEKQLELLGIDPDGSIHPITELQDKGIFSRRPFDAWTLDRLLALISIILAIYAIISSQQDSVKNEAFQTKTAVTLQNLVSLVQQVSARATQAPEEYFVVRERVAKVRLKPEHGASIEGALLPNEIVRAMDHKGRWVEVEYYHWFHEEYRTGWVLKHYLERVPANYLHPSDRQIERELEGKNE